MLRLQGQSAQIPLPHWRIASVMPSLPTERPQGGGVRGPDGGRRRRRVSETYYPARFENTDRLPSTPHRVPRATVQSHPFLLSSRKRGLEQSMERAVERALEQAAEHMGGTPTEPPPLSGGTVLRLVSSLWQRAPFEDLAVQPRLLKVF